MVVIPSGELSQLAKWKDPPCYSWENIHYFDWAIFHCYVSSPEGNGWLMMVNSG